MVELFSLTTIRVVNEQGSVNLRRHINDEFAAGTALATHHENGPI